MAVMRHFLVRSPVPLLLALLILEGIEYSSAEEDYLPTCCEQGSAWAKQKQSCELFTGPVAGVPSEEQTACLETVDICCRKTFQDADCEQGKADAKAGLSCTRIESSGGLSDYARDCCEGCKLGILTGSSGKSCLFKKFSLGIPWDPAFMECCNEAMTSTTQTKSSTSLSSTSPLSTIGSTSEKDELDELLDELTQTDSDLLTTFESDDLCQVLKGLLCSEICVPTPGSYYCKCYEGSVLQEDRRTCKSNATTITPQSTKSVLQLSSTQPLLSKTLKPTTTIEFSTPLVNGSNQTNVLSTASLHPASTLKLLSTAAKLRSTRSLATEDNELNQPCPAGYRLSPSADTCDDINECTEFGNVCSKPDTICINTLGSFICRNLKEYQQQSKPNQVGIGSDDRRPHDYEATDDGGRETICAFGLKYNSDLKRCDDIDECQLLQPACAVGELCRNTVGGYDCLPASCPRGFVLVNEACQDVDECEQSLHSCAPYERCQNTNGSFTCEPPRPTRRPVSVELPNITCRKGYKLDNKTDDCVDIDECVEGPGCRDHERCRNLMGSYDCFPLCGPGWYFQMQTKTCEDVDECLLGHHNCRQRTHYCRNTKGSYVCEPLSPCPIGYRRSRDGSCVDVDECQEGLHTCSREAHRYCVNRNGSYECITRLPSCNAGFEYSLLTRECEDVDECRSGRARCDPRERCLNLPGTYRCEQPVLDLLRAQSRRPACPAGYSYDPALRKCSGKGVAATAAPAAS